ALREMLVEIVAEAAAPAAVGQRLSRRRNSCTGGGIDRALLRHRRQCVEQGLQATAQLIPEGAFEAETALVVVALLFLGLAIDGARVAFARPRGPALRGQPAPCGRGQGALHRAGDARSLGASAAATAAAAAALAVRAATTAAPIAA